MSDPSVAFDEEAIAANSRSSSGELSSPMLSALLEEEAGDLVNADRYERTADREAYRAGHYERSLTTTSGQGTLRMPKLKGMRFARAIIERCRRRESPVEEVSGRVAAGQATMPKRMGRS